MQKAFPLPSRPTISKGFKAQTIKLTSNHFTVSLKKDQPFIYLYDLKFRDEKNESIPEDARKLMQRIIKSTAEDVKKLYGNNFCVAGKTLWSLKNQKELKTLEAKIDNKKFAVIIQKIKDVNLGSDTFRDNDSAAQVRQYLNVLVKRYFKMQEYVEWGRNSKFYDPNNFADLKAHYLQIYTGFKTSCEVYFNFKPKMLIDFSSRIVRSDSALYYINEAGSQANARDMIQGRSVIASYGNFRMWRVDDVDYKANPLQKFDQEGKQVTLVDYYQQKYGIKIKELKQPLLVSYDRKSGKKFLLVPELVQMTGLEDDMRANNNLMKDVAEYTRLRPSDRMSKVKNGAAYPLADYLDKEYGMKMETDNFVEGYLLTAPKLRLGNKELDPKGNYNLRDPIFKPANFDKWLFVYSEGCAQDAEECLQTLKKCAGAYGIKVGNPLKVSVKGKSAEDLKKAIKSCVKPDTQIVLAMYPHIAKKSWYKALKDLCCKEIGVPCQAILSNSLRKNAMSVCSKLLLQMNAKIGREIWVTEKPKGLPDRTMIIGADVFHNTRIGQEKKSCVGFCASLNSEFNQFFSKVTFQNKLGDEIMKGIGALVKEAVLKYFAFNGKKFFPECIIFYRDGVAENQIQHILEFETTTIIEQLKTIDPDYNFQFAEIIVTKRIDDRIFTTGNDPRKNGYENPPAGTVVYKDIVSNNFDFLLVSQNVTQGTCTPTKYNVIYNTTDLPQDIFWQLTYSQCYNYYNWNGSVRVPAPAQYAHKLAYLVGQTVQGTPHENLDQSLYYL